MEFDLLEYLSVMAVSALKFVPGAFLAMQLDLTLVETILTTAIGGTLGIAIYAYFGERIRDAIIRLRNKGKQKSHPNKKQFKRLRFIIKIWRKFGIWGIAFLTPPILSPPVGTAIALAFGEKAERITFYLGLGCIFWALLLAFFGDFIRAILA